MCRLPKETRTIVYNGPDPVPILEQYKKDLIAKYGPTEKQQQEGLKKEYGAQWEKWYLSQEDLNKYKASRTQVNA